MNCNNLQLLYLIFQPLLLHTQNPGASNVNFYNMIVSYDGNITRQTPNNSNKVC